MNIVLLSENVSYSPRILILKYHHNAAVVANLVMYYKICCYIMDLDLATLRNFKSLAISPN